MHQELSLLSVPGFRFYPEDEELFCHFLYRKIHNALSPIEYSVVRVCDLYGNDEPWTVWQRYGGDFLSVKDDLYFFTRIKKKNGGNSKRFDRTVGVDRNGTWSGEDKGDRFQFEVKGTDGNCFNLQGFKKRFRYENPLVPEQNGCWIMHEYSLPDESSEWVVCRLRKNDRAMAAIEEEKKKTSKRSRGEIVGFEDNKKEVLSSKKRNMLETEFSLPSAEISPQNQQLMCFRSSEIKLHNPQVMCFQASETSLQHQELMYLPLTETRLGNQEIMSSNMKEICSIANFSQSLRYEDSLEATCDDDLLFNIDELLNDLQSNDPEKTNHIGNTCDLQGDKPEERVTGNGETTASSDVDEEPLAYFDFNRWMYDICQHK